LGDQNLKNISQPIRAYAVVREKSATTTMSRVAGGLPSGLSPPRLVLPFANLSGDSEQDYFVDGVTESLTTDLSRISGSFVIGRHTAFTYKAKAVDLKQIGRELNVRYVLEGSVQRSGNRLRVNAQLINAETGTHLWAKRFEKAFTDVFDMQDEIVSRLANALDTQLIEAEARRAQRSLNPDAMDLIFQGNDLWNKAPMMPERLARARGFFERALAIDPESIDALVGVAKVSAARAFLYRDDDTKAQYAAAEALLTKALSMAPQHASAHLYLGIVKTSTNRVAQGISEFEQALSLDRNLANAHGSIGGAKTLIGRSEETEAHVEEALRLSPRDPAVFRWLHFVGLAKLLLGADVEAVVCFRRCLETN
jgi:TolB-like protein